MTTLLPPIKSRLAELERTIIGVKRAYTEAPATLPHADLPSSVILWGLPPILH